ncbi:MAG: hypothetical protein PUB22_00735 [Clostridiales bacterium]|nr:hypothetical protein [Clostridiales bacterium]
MLSAAIRESDIKEDPLGYSATADGGEYLWQSFSVKKEFRERNSFFFLETRHRKYRCVLYGIIINPASKQ